MQRTPIKTCPDCGRHWVETVSQCHCGHLFIHRPSAQPQPIQQTYPQKTLNNPQPLMAKDELIWHGFTRNTITSFKIISVFAVLILTFIFFGSQTDPDSRPFSQEEFSAAFDQNIEATNNANIKPDETPSYHQEETPAYQDDIYVYEIPQPSYRRPYNTYVRGYYRRNGTYVRPHYRRSR